MKSKNRILFFREFKQVAKSINLFSFNFVLTKSFTKLIITISIIFDMIDHILSCKSI
jgi:hypothetical protein